MNPDGKTYRDGNATDNSKAHTGTDVCHTYKQPMNKIHHVKVECAYLNDYYHEEEKAEEAHEIPPIWYLRVVTHELRVNVILLYANLLHPIQQTSAMIKDRVHQYTCR
jgi:hypothetical protein